MGIPSSYSSLPDSQLLNTRLTSLTDAAPCEEIEITMFQRALSVRRRKADADHAKNRPLPVVRFAGRGSRGVLRLGVQELEVHPRGSIRQSRAGNAQAAAGFRDDRRVRDR